MSIWEMNALIVRQNKKMNIVPSLYSDHGLISFAKLPALCIQFTGLFVQSVKAVAGGILRRAVHYNFIT